MPYAAVSGSRGIQVLAYELTMDPLPASKKQGESLFFTGRLTSGGVGTPGMIELYKATVLIGSGTAGSDGYYSIAWTVPYGLGCTNQAFHTKHPPSGTWSASRSMLIAFNTRISISAPGTVGAGASFAVTGKLEYESTGAGVWAGLAGKAVSVVYDSTALGSGTTGSDGSYSITGSIPSGGTYTLKATYGGEGFFSPAEAIVKLFTTGELEPILVEIGSAALAFAPVIFVVSCILANVIGTR